MILYKCIRNYFSKLKKQQILDSSYEQLTKLMVKRYGNKQYKNSNAACLHQIQHHFKILSPGDWVLDIGAGPNFYWTDLALQLTDHQQNTRKVISNDIVPCSRAQPNNPFVPGDFKQQQIRTNVALRLGQNKLDTILVDVSTTFTGDLQKDSMQMNEIIHQALFFSNTFLKKGGNFICKVLQSQSSRVIQQTSKIYFHQFTSFKPSIIRQRSPVRFYVMKGFAMNHNLSALQQFYKKYRGSPKNKTQVVKQYQGKYSWDPVDMLNKRAKDNVLVLRQQGRSQKDIENMYTNDPFVKITKILKQLKQLQKAYHLNDQILIQKAVNQYSDGKLFAKSKLIPTSKEQWIDYLQKKQNDLRQFKNKQKNKKQQKQTNKQNLAPLGQQQFYMRTVTQVPQERQQPIYIQADLDGNYSSRYEDQYINQQLEKLARINPQGAQQIQNMRRRGDKKLDLQQIFTKSGMSQEQMQTRVGQFKQTLKIVTEQQYKQMMDKEGYQQQIKEILEKKDKSARAKYRNN